MSREGDGPDPRAYWLLIAVLKSTFPLSQEVASRLYQAAYRLYKQDLKMERLAGDLLSGKVVRLPQDMVLGSIAGPAFEAEISTERGEGLVQFLLTRQGLEEDDDVPMPKPSRPQLLN